VFLKAATSDSSSLWRCLPTLLEVLRALLVISGAILSRQSIRPEFLSSLPFTLTRRANSAHHLSRSGLGAFPFSKPGEHKGSRKGSLTFSPPHAPRDTVHTNHAYLERV
jgi:hypothetical protein